MMSKGMSWSDLPRDVLQIICDQKLCDAKDYLRFGAVCTSWRSAVWLSRYQVPVLMFLNSSREYNLNPVKTKYKHAFFSIREDLQVPILPVTSEVYISDCGSCHGWLLINKSIRSEDMLQLHLWNPFSSVDIELPSLQGEWIVKFTLSNNPTWKSDYAVMVIYYLNFYDNCKRRLALFKTGDKSWTYIDNQYDQHGSSLYFNNVIFYKHQFYVLCSSELLSCDFTQTKPKLTRVASLPPYYIMYSYGYDNLCLVESSGDLLCVAREVDYCDKNCTVGFRIFKFLTNEESHWIELKTLRGHTLFLSDCTSLSLLSSNFHQCKSNHIYFAYNHNGNSHIDEGMFNLEDSNRKLLFSGNMINAPLYDLVWVQPTLNITKDSASSELNVGVFNLEDANLQPEQITNPILVQPSTLNMTTDSAPHKLNVGVFNLEEASFRPLFSENVHEQLTNPILVQPPTLNMIMDSASHELNVGVFNFEDTSLQPLFSENVNEQLTNPILVQPPTLLNMTTPLPKSASGSTKKTRIHHHIRKLLNCLGCLPNVERVVVGVEIQLLYIGMFFTFFIWIFLWAT